MLQGDGLSSAVLLLPFFLPVIAPSFRSLWKFAFVAFVPALICAGLMLVPGDGRILRYFLGFLAAALMGTLGRWASFTARGYGINRPWSLVIDAVFFVIAVAFVNVAGL